jgi:general secretion pathway protein F
MRFRAKVLNAAMGVELVEVDAIDAIEALRVVESSGVQVLDLRVARIGLSPRARQKPFNLAIFNEQLHSLLAAGQTVVDAIDILGHNDRRGKHRAIYDTLLQSLKSGNQMSAAMAALPSVFPVLYVAMVRASETTGSIQAAVQRFMAYQRQIGAIRSKLAAAATYPAILLAVGYVVISFLMLYVLPRFSAVYEDAEKNADGFVRLWGTFVRDHTLLAWSGVLLIGVGMLFVVLHPATRRGAFRRLLAMPWIGERMWILQLARLYRTLGMLLKSGVSVLHAMRMTQASLPVAMQGDLTLAVRLVSEGRALSSVMSECKLSTEVAERLLLAGEASGNLDDMMERIADFYDQETAHWIDTASRLIEPVLMIVIGLVIGAIVLMLYSPIFELANIV